MRESKSLLAEIIDITLLVVALTAGLFLVMRTRLKLLDAAAAALAASACLLAFFRSKDELKRTEQKRNRKFNEACETLTFAGEKFRLEYFARALSRFGKFDIESGCLTGDTKRVYPLFVPEAALPAELSHINDECADTDAKAVVILPFAPDKKSSEFIAGCGRIKALYGEKLRALLEDTPLETPEKRRKSKGRFKRLLGAALSRELFRRYLFSGLLLIGTSYVLPTSPLYIAVGSLCLVLAAVTLSPIGKRKATRR